MLAIIDAGSMFMRYYKAPGEEIRNGENVIALTRFEKLLRSFHSERQHTEDGDLHSLLSSHCRMIKNSGKKVFSVGDFQERYGILHSQWLDWKALVGDESDFIPGVDGVGEKIASKWLQDFESLDGIFQNIEAMTAAKRKALAASEVYAMRELMRLRTVKIPKLGDKSKVTLADGSGEFWSWYQEITEGVVA